MNHSFKLKNATFLMALAAIYPLSGQAESGVTQFAVGDVTVRRGQTTLPVTRGQLINSGDSIVTGSRGQAQVRFSDGGLVSLAPNSQFNIDKYADENKPDDGFFASLLRGGMRAITGLVGKRDRNNYKISTTTATIGIRGSAFSANYNPDGSINIAGEQDGIFVCTNAGCVDLIIGEAVKVTGDNVLPARTAERSNVPPLAARQDLFAAVDPIVVQLVPLPPIPPAPAPDPQINGVLSGVSAMFAVSGSEYNDQTLYGGEHPSDGQASFVNGLMVRHESMQNSYVEESFQVSDLATGTIIWNKTSAEVGPFATVGSATSTSFIGWGFWDLGQVNYSTDQYEAMVESTSETMGIHYLVGRPTPELNMPMSGAVAYTLLGGTPPTRYAYDGNSNVLSKGSLLSAGLNVDFSAMRVNAFVNTSFITGSGTVAVRISSFGEVAGSTFFSTSEGNGFSYGAQDSYFSGFFTGDQAAFAGMVYGYNYSPIGDVRGVAVFQRGGTGDAFTEQTGMFGLFAASEDNGDSLFSDTLRDDGEDTGVRGGSNPNNGTGYFLGNQLIAHDDGEDGGSVYVAASKPASSFGSLGNVSDMNYIGWGYWDRASFEDNWAENSGTANGVHSIVGRPTPTNGMPTDAEATYVHQMVGGAISGTAPIASYGGNSIIGTLVGARLDVNFGNVKGTGSVTATVNTQFSVSGTPVNVDIVQGGTINGATFRGSDGCGKDIRGFFVGNNAERAGMIYRKDTNNSFASPSGPQIGTVTGAVALQRGALTPVD